MAHDATLHVKIERATNEQLARLAAARKTSKGQLVRDAILTCYQVTVNDLPIRQRRHCIEFGIPVTGTTSSATRSTPASATEKRCGRFCHDPPGRALTLALLERLSPAAASGETGT